jgi:hypothetical protein
MRPGGTGRPKGWQATSRASARCSTLAGQAHKPAAGREGEARASLCCETAGKRSGWAARAYFAASERLAWLSTRGPRSETVGDWEARAGLEAGERPAGRVHIAAPVMRSGWWGLAGKGLTRALVCDLVKSRGSEGVLAIGEVYSPATQLAAELRRRQGVRSKAFFRVKPVCNLYREGCKLSAHLAGG